MTEGHFHMRVMKSCLQQHVPQSTDLQQNHESTDLQQNKMSELLNKRPSWRDLHVAAIHDEQVNSQEDHSGSWTVHLHSSKLYK